MFTPRSNYINKLPLTRTTYTTACSWFRSHKVDRNSVTVTWDRTKMHACNAHQKICSDMLCVYWMCCTNSFFFCFYHFSDERKRSLILWITHIPFDSLPFSLSVHGIDDFVIVCRGIALTHIHRHFLEKISCFYVSIVTRAHQ